MSSAAARELVDHPVGVEGGDARNHLHDTFGRGDRDFSVVYSFDPRHVVDGTKGGGKLPGDLRGSVYVVYLSRALVSGSFHEGPT